MFVSFRSRARRQYWPNKFVLFSWIANENATKPVDIFYGKYDDNVGGFQVRIVGRGWAARERATARLS